MKKFFLSTAVAAATALSLSVAAFASGSAGGSSPRPADQYPGGEFSFEGIAAVAEKQIIDGKARFTVVQENGQSIDLSADPSVLENVDYVVFRTTTSSTRLNNIDNAAKGNLSNYAPVLKGGELGASDVDLVTSIDFSLYQWENEATREAKKLNTSKLSGDVTVTISYTGRTPNAVGYVDSENVANDGWLKIDSSSPLAVSFKTNHFSEYALFYLNEDRIDIAKLTDPATYPAYAASTTTAAEESAPAESTTDSETTTADVEPDVTTVMNSDTSDTDVLPQEVDETSSASTAATTNPEDKNQSTGVAVAVIPAAVAAVAAAAIVLSKKRK